MTKLLRQKPLTVQAVKFEDKASGQEIIDLAFEGGLPARETSHLHIGDGSNMLYSIQITTSDGYFYVRPGSWVVFEGERCFRILTDDQVHNRYEEI